MQKIFDFIVIGSGIAGLNTALTLAPHGTVLIITKKKLNASATFFAQGGIAAVTKKDDSLLSHANDTLTAGYNHNKKQAVDFLVKGGSRAVDRLVSFGVSFDKQQDGDFVTSYEAAHSYPRILHATDFTGQEIQKALVANVLGNNAITVWEHAYAVELLIKQNTCVGVQILRQNKIHSLFSRAVILATGGAGQLYQWTTNPSVATADGIALAKRAGALMEDLEFIQFHPTALQGNTAQLFLLSEALRGEGAHLVDKKGKRFMLNIHPHAELAPRDVVARAIFQKQKEGPVYLDLRHKEKTFLFKRFPKISSELKKRGIDISKDLIPVTPAAHFLCGGIATDLYGRTSVKNLFAYGETAATGVHGANRLASNSLLEGIVFSSQIEKCLDELPRKAQSKTIKSIYRVSSLKPTITKKQVKQIMWKFVGIERTPEGLRHARQELQKLKKKTYATHGVNSKQLEITNIIEAALAITHSAIVREQSLGTHYLSTH